MKKIKQTKKNNTKRKIYQQTTISMLVAILIIQTFVPGLGYIPLGPIDATIVHITVILAAVLFGTKTGLIMGGIWGLLSMLRAILQPTAFNAVFLNPLISIVPRLIVGLLSGWIFQLLYKKISERWSYILIGLIGSVTNTVLVLGAIYLLGSATYAQAMGVPESALLGVLATVVLTNGIIETVVSMVLMPLIASPLARSLSRNKK